MSRLFDVVRALEADTLTAEQRAGLSRLLMAVDVAVELDAEAHGYTGRAHWSVAAAAFRELVPGDTVVVPMRRTCG